MRSARFCACIMVALMLSACVEGGWPPSSSSGFSDCSEDIQVGAQTPYRVIAAADWNNNQKVDLVAVSATQPSQLQIWEWSSDDHQFLQSANLTLPADIVTGMAVDVNRDGRVDVVVTVVTNHVYVILQNFTGLPMLPVLLTANQLVPRSVNLLNIYDACARPWVYGVDVTTGNGVFTVLDVGVDKGGCNFGSEVTTVQTNYAAVRNAAVFSAGADLTGDCLADIVLSNTDAVKTNYWYLETTNPADFAMANNESIVSAAKALFSVPLSFGAPSIADWNGDGSMDFLFPACLDQDMTPMSTPCAQYNFLVMLPNQANSLCSGDDCCSEAGVSFNSVTEQTQVNVTSTGMRFFNLSTCPNPATRLNLTVVIREGDYNDDGVLDAAFATNQGPTYLTGRTDSQFFDCASLRVRLLDNKEGVLTEPRADPFFFDIDDDGRLDLLTTISDPAAARVSGGGVFAFWSDAATIGNYFLTAMTVNGASVGGSTAWGANVVGATHRFQYIDINQNTHVASTTQAITAGGNALRQPRAHFGLAVTFSYISNYATGYARNGFVAKRQWPVYLMPNSQVVVVASPNSDPDDWALKLFLYGQRFMQLVLIGWLASLGIIGLPLSVLKLRELQSDRRELHRHD